MTLFDIYLSPDAEGGTPPASEGATDTSGAQGDVDGDYPDRDQPTGDSAEAEPYDLGWEEKTEEEQKPEQKPEAEKAKEGTPPADLSGKMAELEEKLATQTRKSDEYLAYLRNIHQQGIVDSNGNIQPKVLEALKKIDSDAQAKPGRTETEVDDDAVKRLTDITNLDAESAKKFIELIRGDLDKSVGKSLSTLKAEMQKEVDARVAEDSRNRELIERKKTNVEKWGKFKADNKDLLGHPEYGAKARRVLAEAEALSKPYFPTDPDHAYDYAEKHFRSQLAEEKIQIETIKARRLADEKQDKRRKNAAPATSGGDTGLVQKSEAEKRREIITGGMNDRLDKLRAFTQESQNRARAARGGT